MTNLTGYNLYRNTLPVTAGMTAVTLGYPGNLNGPVTDATVLTHGSTYYYFLQAVNPGGGSAFVSAGFQMPPSPPSPLTGQSTASAITLAWNASAGAVSYTVYETSPAAATLGVTNTLFFPITTGLNPGINYTYQVTASDYGSGAITGGESLPSTQLTWGLLPQPIAVSSVAISLLSASNQTAATVTWNPDTEANATSVSLLYAPTTFVASATRVDFGAAVTTGIVNLLPDKTYNFWVEGVNPYGSGPPIFPAPATLTYPAAVSLAPVSLTSDGISRVLTWAPKNAPVTQYVIYREVTGSGNWQAAEQLPGNVSLPVTVSLPIESGTSYDYEIQAANATGFGPFSNVQTFTSLPAAPQTVTAQSGLSTANSAVSLSWADPNAGTEGVTVYTIYRSPDNAATTNYAAQASVTVAPSPTPPIYYNDVTAAPASLYYYLITADDPAKGVTTLLDTANAVSVTAYAAPNTVTGFSASPSNTAVQLNWTAAVSTTYQVAGYEIYQSTSASVTGTVPVNPTPVVPASLNVTGLTNGTPYYFWVGTMDTAGHISDLSGPVSATPLNAPGVPGNMSFADGDEAVQISWNASLPGTLPIGGYQVYRATVLGGPYAPLTFLGPTGTGYVDEPLANGTTYYYYVVAVDNSGVTTGQDASANSVTVNGTPALSDINPPSGLAATGGIGQVVLTWTDSFAGLGSPVTGYQVYRSTNTSGPFTLLTSPVTGTSPYTDSTVNNGTTYYYYFVAYVGATPSSNSVTVTAVPARPPSVPSGVTGVDGNASVTLNWTPNTPVDNVPVTEYVYYPTPGSPTTVYSASATATSLSNGSTYVYQVQAVNTNGVTGGLSAPVTDYPFILTAPLALASGGGVTNLTLSWNPPLTNTYPLGNYDLQRLVYSGASTYLTTPNASPVTDTNVTQGQLYIYTVQATDSLGHVSAPSNAVTDAACNPPTAPATLVATAGDGQILIDFPASVPTPGSLPVSYYILTGSDGVSLQLPATQTWFLDNNNGSRLTDPTTVTYSLQAVDVTGLTTGNHISVSTASAPATTSSADLNPPTGLTAKALSNSKAQLTWNQPYFGALNVTSFNIYRGSSYGSYVLIGSVPNSFLAPVTTYTDSSVFANNTYYYVVRAVYTTAGGVSTESPNSNHAVITMPQGSNAPTVSSGDMAFDANLVLPNSGQKLGIYFVPPASGPVKIKIYSINGRLIRTLTPPDAAAGTPENLIWDMNDRIGSLVSSGIYFIEMDGPGGFHLVKKVAVVK